MTLNLTGNKTVKLNDPSMLKIFEEQIDAHWVDLVSDLSASHYNFVRLSNYQDFLFDRYMARLDTAIEKALDGLGNYDDDIILDEELQKAASDVHGIYHQFKAELFVIMRDILIKADSNNEVMVAFYVLYTIYAEMQDDQELRFQISGYNPLFYQTLQDFVLIYADAIGMPLPLNEGFRDGLDMYQNPGIHN